MCEQVKYGFDCVCDHIKKFPGTNEYSCEICGIYSASKPRCNKCEEDKGKKDRIMTSMEILNKITSRGFFVYEPDLWCVENDMALKELLDSELVQRASDINPTEMNGSYVYIEKKHGRR